MQETDSTEAMPPGCPSEADKAAMPGRADATNRCIDVASFVQAFKVTFLFEEQLMEVRRHCFDDCKTCALPACILGAHAMSSDKVCGCTSIGLFGRLSAGLQDYVGHSTCPRVQAMIEACYCTLHSLQRCLLRRVAFRASQQQCFRRRLLLRPATPPPRNLPSFPLRTF